MIVSVTSVQSTRQCTDQTNFCINFSQIIGIIVPFKIVYYFMKTNLYKENICYATITNSTQ